MEYYKLIGYSFCFLSICYLIFGLVNWILALFNKGSSIDNTGFALAGFFALSLTLVFTILKQDLDMRSYQISETEKRLEKFYIPTKELIENIKKNNFCLQDNYKNTIKEINRYKYLIDEKNDKPKSLFIKFENVLTNKTYLDTNDIWDIIELLSLLEQDIDFYEKNRISISKIITEISYFNKAASI